MSAQSMLPPKEDKLMLLKQIYQWKVKIPIQINGFYQEHVYY